jgi:hypothetical protein
MEVAIPATIGLILSLWPKAMFAGSRVPPTEQKLRILKRSGMLLLLVAALFLMIKIVGR